MKILVDGTLAWDELMNQAAYGMLLFSNTSDLNEKNFPLVDKTKRSAMSKLFRVTKDNFRNSVSLMEEENYRPAFLEELLAYAFKNPEAQNKYDIMATGQGWMSHTSGMNYPCLSKSFLGRNITLSSINYQRHYGGDTRFLGIKKV